MTGDRRTKTALASGPAPGTGGDRRFAGRRALVVGLGVEGVALTRFLVTAGATVTVNDARREDQLGDRLAQLEDVPFMRALGGHDPALVTGADLLFVSQGVPLTQPIVREARRRGLPVGSVATLLFEICAGQILGVTGSAGKTTTTALVAAIVARSERPHLLAGNIGSWPLAELARATPETLVVTEISHTQLQLITRGPSVACVTNVTPNHLDQFDWDAYFDLKRTLVRYQRPEDTAVLNLDNAVTRSFSGDTDAEALWFSMGDALPGDGTFLSGERLLWRRRGRDVHVIDTTEILLPGRHNVENVLAATAVAGAAGIPMEYVREAVRAFHGVPHRL